VTEPTGTETAPEGAAELDSYEDAPSEYTTESPETADAGFLGQPVATGPSAGTGRRKQAIARVRIVPGEG
jgi:small subunit ribosomal protein S9